MEKKISVENLMEATIKPLMENWIIENEAYVFGEAENPKRKRSKSDDID